MATVCTKESLLDTLAQGYVAGDYSFSDDSLFPKVEAADRDNMIIKTFANTCDKKT